ncbi:MAG: hypothetical protein K9M45_11750 [Kiritimatiellales bacterium]|nr:hypothetical protein [Kiritimatiellales bacterium]
MKPPRESNDQPARSASPKTGPRFRKLLGNGRSAVVYRMETDHGDTARKVFTGSTAAAILHLVFFGAPLDYRWNEAAVKSAFYRRKTLGLLLKCWFGDTLSMADAYGWGQDNVASALYLDTEYIAGHLARLFSPFLFNQKTEIYHLRNHIMPKLQKHLAEAGLTGTVWQAGYGQPCAFPNFLCVQHGEHEDDHRWVWIDAESGVPAIVSYNLPALFKFYIPQALKRGRILFDDLDAEQLRDYLKQHEAELKEALDSAEWVALNENADRLIEVQAQWTSETRLSRSVGYYSFRGIIDEEQRDFYLKHKLRWHGFLARYLFKKIPQKLLEKIREYLPLIKQKIHPIEWLKFLFAGLFSAKYRLELSRRFVTRGIEHWLRYHRITPEQRDTLLGELHDKDKNLWLGDFGVHLAVKPLGYLLRFSLIPLLVHFNVISLGMAGILFIFMGNALRTSYTLFRAIECMLKRQPVPWTAMVITPIPTFGTLAFPCQMLHSARKGHRISQMIIYETCSASAAAIPIWGGRDNGWDHRFNQFAHRIIVWAL